MYSNFIYFVLALLIFNIYRPPDRFFLGKITTLFSFIALKAFFVILTRVAFNALSRKIDRNGAHGLHSLFDKLVLQQAVLALITFSIDVYILNLPIIAVKILPFSQWATWVGIVFLAHFSLHMAIIWAAAHKPYQQIFGASVSKGAYILGNIRFSVPVVVAWILISGLWDLASLFPFEGPRQWLDSLEGQLILSATFLAAVAVIAPALVKTFWNCKPLVQGPARERIEAICNKAKIGYANILDWPLFEGKFLSAGVMGLVKKFRYILVTRGLLDILKDEELEAVMAHEIGHVKKHHLVLYLIFFIGFAVITIPVDALIQYGFMFSSVMLPRKWHTLFLAPNAVSAFRAIATIIVFLIYFRYIFGYFMRNCERQADVYAISLTGSGRGIVSSLEKIARYCGNIHDRPSWHHFSIRQRIDFVNKCEQDKKWISHHDRKLRNNVTIFVFAVCLVGYAGYSIHSGELRDDIQNLYQKKWFNRIIEQNPDKPHLHHMLGDYYTTNMDYEKAIRAYKKAVELEPNNAEALNNLAWMYATCEDTKLRNPALALTYAKEAVSLSPSSHVLDTLAESYYVNGLHEEAVTTIKKALALNPIDQQYYKDQLEKFEKALAKSGGV